MKPHAGRTKETGIRFKGRGDEAHFLKWHKATGGTNRLVDRIPK